MRGDGKLLSPERRRRAVTVAAGTLHGTGLMQAHLPFDQQPDLLLHAAVILGRHGLEAVVDVLGEAPQAECWHRDATKVRSKRKCFWPRFLSSPHHLQQIFHPRQPDPAPAPGQPIQHLIAGAALHLQHPGAGAGQQQSGALQEILAQGRAIVAKPAVGMA